MYKYIQHNTYIIAPSHTHTQDTKGAHVQCAQTTEDIHSTVQGSMHGTVLDTPQMSYIHMSHSI